MDAALTFTAIQEPQPSAERIRALLPVLEAWYLRDGDAARPTYGAARRALQEHMPELYPTWVTLCERAGGGDVAARVLSLYDSVERRAALCAATTASAFLEPPLYATEFARGFGTLYTAVYRPGSRAVTYRWPHESWHQSLSAFTPGSRTVRLSEGADRTGPR